MIVELRTYTMKPGRSADFVELYRAAGLALQKKHLGTLIGFYVSEIGALNQVVHLWQFASLADREQRRQALDADPAWAAYRTQSRQLDAILAQDSQILRPTSFSPTWA